MTICAFVLLVGSILSFNKIMQPNSVIYDETAENTKTNERQSLEEIQTEEQNTNKAMSGDEDSRKSTPEPIMDEAANTQQIPPISEDNDDTDEPKYIPPKIDVTFLNSNLSNVDRFLFGNSQASFGYKIDNDQLSTSRRYPFDWFSAKAYADSISYQPIYFYYGTTGIDILYTATGQSSEIVKGGASPTFSSTSQLLAYKKACSLYIKNLRNDKDFLIQEGFEPKQPTYETSCFTPIEWSPNGKILAFSETNLANANLGYVHVSHLYFFDVEANTITRAIYPTGYGSGSSGLGYNSGWLDDDRFAFDYSEFGMHADLIKTEHYILSLEAQQLSKTEGEVSYSIRDTQTVGDIMYSFKNYKKNVEPSIITANKDGSNVQSISKTEGAYRFLLKTDPAASFVTDIYFTIGDAGTLDSFTLKKLSLDDNQLTDVFNPSGYAVSLIGWGKNFESIIYSVYMSSHTEIRELNLITSKEEVLSITTQ